MYQFLRIISFLKSALIYKHIFKEIGSRTIVKNPLKIENGKNISIGNYVIIGYKSWLAASPLTGNKCELIIRDGCSIGNFSHIFATQSIIIEESVLIADKVYISDNLHGYEDICKPIIKQDIIQKGCVIIKEGSWIGESVSIIGVTIGRNSVIGANSVVTKDIPDYCIAVGSPARIIKRFCFEKQEWCKTDSNGEII